MSKFIASSAIFDALHDAGVIEQEPRTVRRVVIDLKVGTVAMVYVEQFADDEKLAAAITDVGIHITGTET
jgi:hypothetical protein